MAISLTDNYKISYGQAVQQHQSFLNANDKSWYNNFALLDRVSTSRAKSFAFCSSSSDAAVPEINMPIAEDNTEESMPVSANASFGADSKNTFLSNTLNKPSWRTDVSNHYSMNDLQLAPCAMPNLSIAPTGTVGTMDQLMLAPAGAGGSFNQLI